MAKIPYPGDWSDIDITLYIEQPSYRDKLRLVAQLLIQLARKEEEQNPEHRVTSSYSSSPSP